MGTAGARRGHGGVTAEHDGTERASASVAIFGRLIDLRLRRRRPSDFPNGKGAVVFVVRSS